VTHQHSDSGIAGRSSALSSDAGPGASPVGVGSAASMRKDYCI